jgi:hypothetical protein
LRYVCLTGWGGNSILPPMSAVESSLRQLLKTNPDFLRVCQQFGWGKIEIAVKDGKPVMISVKRDIKIE